MKYTVRVPGREYDVRIEGEGPAYRVAIDGRAFQVDAADLGDDSLLTMILDNQSLLAHTRIADADRGLVDVSIGGKYRRLEVLDELASAVRHAAEQDHRSQCHTEP